MIEQDRKDREAKRVSASTSVPQVVSKVQEPKIDNKSDEARLQVNWKDVTRWCVWWLSC